MLYVHIFEIDSWLYDMLYFDRMKRLNGYYLKVGIYQHPIAFDYDETKIGYDRFSGYKVELICVALKYLNARINVKKFDSFGWFDEQNNPHGMIKDVLFNSVDTMINPYFLSDYWKRQAYPLYSDKLKIISVKHLVKYADRFLFMFNARVMVSFIIIFCASMVLLKLILQQSTSNVALEFLRISVGASTLKQPKNYCRKFFFFIFIMATFTISSYFDSNLKVINIVPGQPLIIDSIEDLLESNLTLHGPSNLRYSLFTTKIRKHYNILGFDKCFNRLLKDDHIACLNIESISKLYTYKNQSIHTSKNNVAERYFTYVFAEDSPLLHKFNCIFIRMVEGGFVTLLSGREEYRFVRNQEVRESKKSLSIDDFIAVFSTLVIGWITALFGLIVEVTFKLLKNIHFRIFKNNS